MYMSDSAIHSFVVLPSDQSIGLTQRVSAVHHKTLPSSSLELEDSTSRFEAIL